MKVFDSYNRFVCISMSSSLSIVESRLNSRGSRLEVRELARKNPKFM